MWRQFNFWVNYVEFFYLTCLKLNLLHSFFFSLNLNQALMTSSLKQTERKWRLTRWKVQHCLWKCLLRISSIRHKNVTCPCSPFCSWEMYAVAKIQFFTKNSFAKLTNICAFVFTNLSFCSFVKILEKLIKA